VDTARWIRPGGYGPVDTARWIRPGGYGPVGLACVRAHACERSSAAVQGPAGAAFDPWPAAAAAGPAAAATAGPCGGGGAEERGGGEDADAGRAGQSSARWDGVGV
jgi:hypothetical protein